MKLYITIESDTTRKVLHQGGNENITSYYNNTERKMVAKIDYTDKKIKVYHNDSIEVEIYKQRQNLSE